MSRNIRDLIEKHNQKLKSVSHSWNDAIQKANQQIKDNFNTKRNELKERLKRSIDEEQQLKNKYQMNEDRLIMEVSRLNTQIDAIESQAKSEPTFDVSAETQRKTQLMEQIYSHTHNDIVLVLGRHRENVQRLEDNLKRRAPPEKSPKSLGSLTDLINPIKNTLDTKKKNLNETLSKLETIREDIEKKLKELAETSRKEAEDITNSEQRSLENEAKDRKEEMTKFINKIKDKIKT